MNTQLRETLKGLRLFLGLSAADWAAAVGVSETLIYLTEDGSRRITGDYLDKVCAAFHIKLDRIMGNIPEAYISFIKANRL